MGNQIINTIVNDIMNGGEKRHITKHQEEVFRACHQDHEGLTINEAANKFNVNPREIYRVLAEVKKIAPQLFPILSEDSTDILGLWYIDGLSLTQIALMLDETPNAIQKRLRRLKVKLGFTAAVGKRNRILSLDTDYVDYKSIKHKF